MTTLSSISRCEGGALRHKHKYKLVAEVDPELDKIYLFKALFFQCRVCDRLLPVKRSYLYGKLLWL